MGLKDTAEYKTFREAFKALEINLREKVYILGCLPREGQSDGETQGLLNQTD